MNENWVALPIWVADFIGNLVLMTLFYLSIAKTVDHFFDHK
jgi:hypothetical protein